MSPIKGLTEVRRLPRIDKIRLGIKKVSQRTGKEYPVATPYFVCPPVVQAIYGSEPKRLDVIIPVEDDELWASQYYRQYSHSRGLVCKGDGVTCRRMCDIATGDVASRDTKDVTWKEGIPCPGRDCPDYQRGDCQEVMNLQVILPKVPGLGVWQVDTSSINSIRNINDCATMIRAVCDRVSWIPLTLSLEPTEVVNPDDGKKKVVYCMHLRQDKGLLELLEASNKPRTTLLISAPVDDEEPMDKLPSIKSKESKEAFEGKVEDDIDELWPQGKAQEVAIPSQVRTSTSSPAPASPSVEVKGTSDDNTGAVDALFQAKYGISFIDAVEQLQWADFSGYLTYKYKVRGNTASEKVSKLNSTQAKEVAKELQERLDM